jgi:hypothetical protein
MWSTGHVQDFGITQAANYQGWKITQPFPAHAEYPSYHQTDQKWYKKYIQGPSKAKRGQTPKKFYLDPKQPVSKMI